MVTMAQRIEALRSEAGLSRPALAAALGFPKGAFDKFETGRQTPSKEQQEKLAAYFGVSLLYLRGESGDRTRQEDWMNLAMSQPDETGYTPVRPAPKKIRQETAAQGTVMDALLTSRQVQESMRGVILETLRSPEGQQILEQVIRRVMGRP
jgi:transcriptional regulator with XRE-family HTH domain